MQLLAFTVVVITGRLVRGRTRLDIKRTLRTLRTVMAAISVTQARNSWADVFGRAVQDGSPVAIERGRGEQGLLIGFDQIRLLVDRYPFTTEVFFEPGTVSIWVPEFQLYGRGASFSEAQDDLVDEVRAYVEEYLADARLYLHSPNRSPQFPWILRAYVADTAGELAAVLFAPPLVEATQTPVAAA